MRSTFILASAAIMLAGPAFAGSCSGGPFLTPPQINTAFNGKYLYDVKGTNPSYDELHTLSITGNRGSGSITEYKRGPTSPTEPTAANYATVSVTANISGAAILKYTYASGYTTPSLSVTNLSGSTYLFCSGASIFTTSIADSSPGYTGSP